MADLEDFPSALNSSAPSDASDGADPMDLHDSSPDNPQAVLNLTEDDIEAGLAEDPIAARFESLRRVEAVLFASEHAVPAPRLREVLCEGVELAEILMALKEDYAQRGVTLEEVAGKWRFQTAPDLAFLFEETRHEVRKLSQAAMETLAIIAYGGPVSRAEIEAVRGVAVSKTIIESLLDTGWVRPAGHRDAPGRPMTYKTTPVFLEEFGLASLNHLPGKAELKADGLLDPMPPMPEQKELEPSEEAPAEVDFVQDYNAGESAED